VRPAHGPVKAILGGGPPLARAAAAALLSRLCITPAFQEGGQVTGQFRIVQVSTLVCGNMPPLLLMYESARGIFAHGVKAILTPPLVPWLRGRWRRGS